MNRRRRILASIAALGLVGALYYGIRGFRPEKHVLIAIWNVRGYPEKTDGRKDWFSEQLVDMGPDIICVQEIANQSKVDEFLANEEHFTSVAFSDSSDGQDNAIFVADWVEMEDMADPTGFQHPAQRAYVSYKGFDAVIVTVHLSWTNASLRDQEKRLLKGVVDEALKKDPDVMIAGDFNITEQEIDQLARSIGMQVMVPLEQEGVGTTHAGNRYDHFLISADLATEEAVACEIQTYDGNDLQVAKGVSDHLPVLAVFSAASRYKDRE